MKIGWELTEKSAKLINPGWWIKCESDYSDTVDLLLLLKASH